MAEFSKQLTIGKMDDKELVIIYTDGGSRGNPGPAGAGAVLCRGGENISKISEYLGVQTNNFAEYTALVLALQKAKDMGVRNVEVRMDSELIVKQMTGAYRVKNSGLIPLFTKARRLADEFPNFHIVHVRREFNKEADSLANLAMDKKA
jgi:ribonuclease HI